MCKARPLPAFKRYLGNCAHPKTARLTRVFGCARPVRCLPSSVTSAIAHTQKPGGLPEIFGCARPVRCLPSSATSAIARAHFTARLVDRREVGKFDATTVDRREVGKFDATTVEGAGGAPSFLLEIRHAAFCLEETSENHVARSFERRVFGCARPVRCLPSSATSAIAHTQKPRA